MIVSNKRPRPLINEGQLAQRVQELGQAISAHYQGQEVTIISVLKGAFMFTADLVRQVSIPVRMEFIGVASYEGTTSSGHVRITNDLTSDIKGKHVLLVEDIIDSGRTIDYLLDTLWVREPASVAVCALLSKPQVHEMKHKLQFVGFEIGDEFVIGYGLDYNGAFRELPYLGLYEA